LSAKAAIASSKPAAVASTARTASMFSAAPELAHQATSLWAPRPPEVSRTRPSSGSTATFGESRAASRAEPRRSPPKHFLEAVAAPHHWSGAPGAASPSTPARSPHDLPPAVIIPQTECATPSVGATSAPATSPLERPMTPAGPSATAAAAARLGERCVDEPAAASDTRTLGADGLLGLAAGEGADSCGFISMHARQGDTFRKAVEGASEGSESEGVEPIEDDSAGDECERGVLADAAVEQEACRSGAPRRWLHAHTSDAACNTDPWDEMLRRIPRGAAAELQSDAGGRSLSSGHASGSFSRSRPGSAASSRPSSARPSSRGEGSGEGRAGSRPGSGYGEWPSLFSDSGTIPEGQPPRPRVELVEEDAHERACREYLQQCFHYLKDSDAPRARVDAPPPSQVRAGRCVAHRIAPLRRPRKLHSPLR
jgi:hypothetical protein